MVSYLLSVPARDVNKINNKSATSGMICQF